MLFTREPRTFSTKCAALMCSHVERGNSAVSDDALFWQLTGFSKEADRSLTNVRATRANTTLLRIIKYSKLNRNETDSFSIALKTTFGNYVPK